MVDAVPVHKTAIVARLGIIKSLCEPGHYQIADDWDNVTCKRCLSMKPKPEVEPALAEAIKDLCWRVIPAGFDAEGNVVRYTVTTGTVHRLVAAAQSAGVSASLRTVEQTDEQPD